jgi:Helix-turn-helix
VQHLAIETALRVDATAKTATGLLTNPVKSASDATSYISARLALMKLGAWIDRKRLTLREFGERIGVDESSVSRYINGGRMPRPEHLAAIMRETNGAVTANDFMAERLPEALGAADEVNDSTDLRSAS